MAEHEVRQEGGKSKARMEERINLAIAPVEDFALLVANLEDKIKSATHPLFCEIESVLSILVKNAKAEIMAAVTESAEA